MVEPGTHWEGFKDHPWNLGWRPLVKVFGLAHGQVFYNYVNCGDPKLDCFLTEKQFLVAFSPERPTKTLIFNISRAQQPRHPVEDAPKEIKSD